MKTIIHKALALLLALFLVICGSALAFADDVQVQNGWQKVGNEKYYMENGVRATGWRTIDKIRYYFDEQGVLQTGFQKIGKNHYYFLTAADVDQENLVGGMADYGVYKNYIISYTGVCCKMPRKKKSKTKSAKAMAKLIAKCAGKSNKAMNDMDKVERATFDVYCFYSNCKYTMKGKLYRTPYGVFYGKQASCAGAARALGLVLKQMGYKWKHVNANKYMHQWCKLKMDGKTGWADASVPGAGYGKHPAA